MLSVVVKMIALAAMAATVLTAGCITSEEYEEPSTKPDLPGYSDLPDNPPGAAGQRWYFGYKSYDNSFRIRWPTYFAAALGVGPGSYTLVDGQLASFRSYDTDGGARRPSYTIPGPSSRFKGTVICILHTADGRAVGWFQANAGATSQGTLP